MAGLVIYTRDLTIASKAGETARAAGLHLTIATDARELEDAVRADAAADLVIDESHPELAACEAQLAGFAARRVIRIVREPSAPVKPGAQAIVIAAASERVLAELANERAVRVPSAVERLLAASVLTGGLEDAIDGAAHEIAIAFAVTRCLISERAETPVVSDGATLDLQAFQYTARLCRASIEWDATVIAPAPNEPSAVDSYVAVALESARGPAGFIGLHASGTRVFTPDERRTLRAIATRIGRELHWRTANRRTAEELERTLNRPGLDPLLGVWNRAALDQIAHAHVSHAKRNKLPLSVLALRVVDLDGVNTRHGVAIGDRLLRRLAEALRPAVRGEDLVGRYSGTMIGIVLQGTGAADARRVAERVHALLAERPLELPDGAQLSLATTIGIAALLENEEATQLLSRAVRATKQAGDLTITVAHGGPTTLSGRIPRPDQSGTQLRSTLGGAYRLRHEISVGGMGIVFRADDLALERPVAVKMLRPELAQNEELVRHLKREAALLARIHHPNLVQIYNFGYAEGDCYFVMELVEGESLQQAIDRHRDENTVMPIMEVLTVVDQIASALDALHERGIVHRDVKPANFIRDPFTSRSVLVDVGIAHKFGELSRQAGTPGFMAPEVIQGIAASPRSDVYGLAASVFAMATCAAPWGEGEPIEIIMRQCNEPPPRLSTLRAELAPIDDVVAAAMSFEADARPASAGELARSLSRSFGRISPRASSKSRQGDPRPEVSAVPRSRGVMFRAVQRVLGVRDHDRLIDALGQKHGELATVLSQSSPLEWQKSALFVQLLEQVPALVQRDPVRFTRDIAHAAVRTSFRSFFPASPQTLHPDRTLGAIRGIWSRYHSWGHVTAISSGPGETIVRMTDTLQVRLVCDWTRELLETLVVVSGGHNPTTLHDACECDGAETCTFRIKWTE